MRERVERQANGCALDVSVGTRKAIARQGQRVRLARAMLRTNVRLAILDEAFRGLDRERRARLMKESRLLWSNITLLCVSHDVVQTRDFDRVLVIENGRVVENGPPRELLADPNSRYAQLVRADEENHRALWRGGNWRNWRIDQGKLEEAHLEERADA